MTNKNVTYSLLLTLATLVLLNSPQPLTYAENQDPYGAVNKFCSQENNTNDPKFCKRVLKSYPRSATAKDNTALLLISDYLAIQKLNKTRDYLASSHQANFNGCLDAYNSGIRKLQTIPAERKHYPDASLVSYDALDAMFQCKNSLEKYKISDPYVLRMHGINMAYVKLCLDIALSVG